MSDNNSNSIWSGVGTQALGMLGGIGQANRQYHRQKRLMGFQQQNQMALNQQGHDLQMDMWNKTNYGAQVKHMRDAGLNPALMYGSAGQGGSTGSQGGGSAAGGNAQAERVMDLSNALTMAQIKGIEAKAEDDLANAADKRGDTPVRKQQVKESIARENDLNASEKLKVQQKLNMITEEKMNSTRQKLDQLKLDNDITGSTLLDAFKTIGLEPKENETDMWIARGMIGAWLGKDFVKMMVDFRKPKPKFKN
jgi:hypothetical protein